MQFHGDGTLDGEVEVVAADSFLREALDAAVEHPALQELLVGGGVQLEPLARLGGLAPFLLGVDASAGGCVRCGSVGTPLLGGPLGGDDRVLAVAAPLDAGLFQAVGDHGPGDTVGAGEGGLGLAGGVPRGDFLDWHGGAPLGAGELDLFGARAEQAALAEFVPQAPGGEPSRLGGDPLQSLPGDVGLDRVVEVSRSDFDGHVYNLETLEGWYSANGIVVHNCRCVAAPLVTGSSLDYGPTGEEAFAALPADTQRQILGPGRHDRYRRGEITLPDMVQRPYSARWGTMRRPGTIADAEHAASLRRARRAA